MPKYLIEFTNSLANKHGVCNINTYINLTKVLTNPYNLDALIDLKMLC